MRPQHRTLIALSGLLLGMFAFSWAMVPLYDLFCDITGLNGKVTEAAAAPTGALAVDSERNLEINFVAHKGDGIPWTFEPVQSSIKIHPGQASVIHFRAVNHSQKRMAARALPSVVPGLATKWLRKTECFCFQEQWLDAGEETLLSMRFYFEEDIPDTYDSIFMAYTLYELEQKES